MKKLFTAAVVGASMVAMSAVSTMAEPIRLKMASTYPSSLTQLGTLGKTLEANINAISGGEVQIKYFEPGALVPALEVFDAVKNGSVDAAWSTPGYWQGKEPSLALFSAVPFGPDAREYGAWLLHGDGEKLMQKVYEKHNIHSFICGVIAPEASGWFREPLKSIDDLKGKKMRFFGLGAKVMQKLGVDTQLVGAAVIYPALERGTIDATEFSMPAIDLNLVFYQIAKHYYFPGWHQQATSFELMINMDKWKSMTDQQKKIIEVACRANYALGMAEGEYIQGAALAELKSKGVTVHTWSDADLAKLKETWEGLVVEIAAGDPAFKEAWDNLQKFRSEYADWKNLGYLK